MPILPSTPLVNWTPAPAVAELEAGDVHVWCACFARHAQLVPRLWAELSDEERDRASQLRFPEDSDRFVFARGVLRDVLLRYAIFVQRPLRIFSGPRGRPFVSVDPGDSQLQFSLSHSRDLVAIAVTLDRGIGIDVECANARADWPLIAGRFFSPAEREHLAALPSSVLPREFLVRWTLKEAYCKGLGVGLALPIDSLTIRLAEDGTPTVEDLAGSRLAPQWLLRSLLFGTDYIGALAVEARSLELSCWSWAPRE